MGYYSSFVVKTWVEDGRMIRGQIQHVGTQETVYFLSLDKMLAFIANHLNPPQESLSEPGEKTSKAMMVQLYLEMERS
jgi:hypothetical protein